jgi:S1-C subfamily serine protease
VSPRWLRALVQWLALAAACTGHSPMAAAADGLPSVIDRVRPSVLAVGFYKETQSPRFGFRGTGFVAGGANLLVTNAHVIEPSGDASNAGSLVVLARDGGDKARIRRAEIVELDKVHDLAVLRFEGPPLPPLALGKPGSVREGQSVAFVGFPLGGVLGFSTVTHRGIVSSITSVALPSPSARQLDDRAINRLREGAFEMLQLDATAYPGNSGGPLIDEETGAVIGVVNMVTLKGTRESALTHPSGISYAIPVDFVVRLLGRIERK